MPVRSECLNWRAGFLFLQSLTDSTLGAIFVYSLAIRNQQKISERCSHNTWRCVMGRKLIGFDGPIYQSKIAELIRCLQEVPVAQKVMINSPGGTFEFFSVLGPALQRQGFTSIGLDVRSAAITLYLLGHRRYALPEAMFFFHEVRAITPHGVISICDLERALEYEKEISESRENVEERLLGLRNAQSWMLSFMRERTGLPTSVFLDLMRNEVVLSAKEAVHFGLVHRVVSEDELNYI